MAFCCTLNLNLRCSLGSHLVLEVHKLDHRQSILCGEIKHNYVCNRINKNLTENKVSNSVYMIK